MDKRIIAKRVFQATKPNGKGIVSATAQFYSLGNQEPHFSLCLTEGYADHETILAAMPELKLLADLHLADGEGMPMHGIANAAYFLKTEEYDKCARTLRISEHEMDEIAKDYVLAAYERRRSPVIPTVVSNWVHDVLRYAPHEAWNENHPAKTRTVGGLATQLSETLTRVRTFLNVRSLTDIRKVKNQTGLTYKSAPKDLRFYREGCPTSVIGGMSDKDLLFCDTAYTKYAGFEFNKAIKMGRVSPSYLKEGLHSLKGVLTRIDKAVRRQVDFDAERFPQEYMRDLIDSCFRSC